MDKKITVLFVSSGNKGGRISPIVKAQGESLIKAGNNVIYYPIVGKGFVGYIRNILKLRKFYLNRKNLINITHTHYLWSSIVASLAGIKPQVVSLMGSDVQENSLRRFIIYLFSTFYWNAVIVKTEHMRNLLRYKDNNFIIPNGVNLDAFYPMERFKSLKVTDWNASKKHILFAANPKLKIKNYPLAYASFLKLDSNIFELHFLEDVPYEKMIFYYNSSDIVLLTSLSEGSVNVIKEAMACNRPIVSTDVGDVKKNIEGCEGCFITAYNPLDVVEKIKLALLYENQTNGRQRIIQKRLDSESIAKKILKAYKQVIND